MEIKKIADSNQIELFVGIKLDNHIKHEYSNHDYFYIFVNSTSGSQEGKIILNTCQMFANEADDKKIVFIYDNLKVLLFDIKNKEGFLLGVDMVKEHTEKIKKNIDENKIRILIGGGDGTVLSIIEDLYNYKIDLTKCLFGHIPLGTGNDLSNSLGFGSSISIKNGDINKLKSIINTYYKSRITGVDIWQMKLILDENDGEIIINKDKQKTAIKYDDKVVTVFKKSFINYLSIGYDARVGFNFEKNRCKTRCCNKFIYFWEGCKKNCCRRTIKINKLIEGFYHIPNTDLMQTMTNITLQEDKATKETIFKTKEEKIKSYEEVLLKGEPVSLICQNINYYMGGTKDIWRKSSSVGLESKDKMILDVDKVQDYNDQKLEFFTYSSGIKIGFEKIKTGQADKIHQGAGPFIIKFKPTPIKNDDKINRVYLNVDGEYYHIVKPIELRIRLNKRLSNGNIKFIRK